MNGAAKRRKRARKPYTNEQAIEDFITGAQELGINTSDYANNTDLICLCQGIITSDTVACLQRLLNVPGINVNYRHKKGVTALGGLVHRNITPLVLDCIKILLNHPGINVHAGNNDTRSPINVLATFCRTALDFEALELLLNAPSLDINAQTKSGKTALMKACKQCPTTSSLECVRRLLAVPEIDLNIVDSYSRNAFDYAMKLAKNTDSPACVKLLLADPRLDLCLDVSFVHPSPIIPLYIHEVCRRLDCNQLPEFSLDRRGQSAGLLDEDLQLQLERSILGTNRLVNFDAPFAWLETLPLEQNYSIIEIPLGGLRANDPAAQRLVYVLVRNRRARSLCLRAAVYGVLCLREKLVPDIAKLIGRLVWGSRGTKEWVREL